MGAWPPANPVQQTQGCFLQWSLRAGPQLCASHARGTQVDPRAQIAPSLTCQGAPTQATDVSRTCTT